MRKIILTAAYGMALMALHTGVQAQKKESDLNRQMEVTRAYEPTVNQATKLEMKPNMVDTVALRPEINYQITPAPVTQHFEVRPIRPASISVDAFQSQRPLYLKAGFGLPAQSLLDAYYNHQTQNGELGAYINHYGYWGKIKNQNNVKAPAMQTTNTLGVTGVHRFGRYAISGEVGYDYDAVTRYGYFSKGEPLSTDFDTTAAGLRQNFSTVRAKVMVGNSFEDLSYFNFRVGVDVANMSDRFDAVETDLKAFVDLGKLFNDTHEVTLRLLYEGSMGAKELSAYQSNIISATPLYRLRTDRFRLMAGADLTYEETPYASKGHIFPKVELNLDLTNGYFVPFLEVNGGLVNNGYRNLSLLNPYLMSGLTLDNTVQYNARVGIAGSFSTSFSYKVYGGWSRYLNMAMFTNYRGGPAPYGNTFVALQDNTTLWTVGGEIEGRISKAFGIEAAVQYRGYKMDELKEAIGLPSLIASLGVRYNIQDKVILRLGANYANSTSFCASSSRYPRNGDLIPNMNPYTYQKRSDIIDLNFGAEYRVSSTMGIFLDASNLADQKLYPYGQYPGMGIRAMLGVKLQF